jgi:hypothetical protein
MLRKGADEILWLIELAGWTRESRSSLVLFRQYIFDYSENRHISTIVINIAALVRLLQ